MNPFYTWPIYFEFISEWICHFNPIGGITDVLEYPISQERSSKGLFLRLCTHYAVELEMLDFYGCLDAMK